MIPTRFASAGGLFVGVLMMAVGCSGDPDDPGFEAPARSTACLEYQDALCDHLADDCGSVSRAECDEDARSFFCRSDAAARSCTAVLATAACGSPPVACQSVVDPRPAIELCERVLATFCARAGQCGSLERSDCEAATQTALECERALGATPAVDACLESLAVMPCSMSLSLADDCQGVIKFRR